MGSARFGQVADALSQGLGLFAGKKADEEKDAADKRWQEALIAQREKNVVTRDKEQNRLADERAATAETSAAERFRVGQKGQTDRAVAANERITKEGELNREARATEGKLDRVRRDEENHYARKAAIDKAMAEALKTAFTAEEKKAVRAMYKTEKEQESLTFVSMMARANKPGFEVDSAAALSSLYQSYGVPSKKADMSAKDSGIFGEDLHPAPGEDPNQFVPSGDLSNQPIYGSSILGGFNSIRRPQAVPESAAARLPSREQFGADGQISEQGSLSRGSSALYNQSFVPDLIESVRSGGRKGKPGEDIPYGTRQF